MQHNADFILKMTATFNNKSQARRVELTERDLNNGAKNDGKWLIKGNLQQIGDDTTNDNALIEKAISEFKKIKELYKTLDYNINPAMLIQVDNEPEEAGKKALFHETLLLLKKKLNYHGFSWVKYFGGDKESHDLRNANFTLDKITRNYDTTDCIIFKIGPATGWDIPRACMLLQLRNVCSSSLNIQTIGRIKRNPYPDLVKNEITDKYYIFTNAPKNSNNDCTVVRYNVKEEFKAEEFVVIKIIQNKKSEIEEAVIAFLTSHSNTICQKIGESFKDGVFVSSDKKITIKNPILLLKYANMKLSNLQGKQREFMAVVKHECEKYIPNQKWHSVWIVLCEYFMDDINRTIQKYCNVQVSYKLHFETINPEIYHDVFDCNNANVVNVSNSNYLFSMVEFGRGSKNQLLDSSPEKVVASKLKTHFETIKVKMWAKNQEAAMFMGNI